MLHDACAVTRADGLSKWARRGSGTSSSSLSPRASSGLPGQPSLVSLSPRAANGGARPSLSSPWHALFLSMSDGQNWQHSHLYMSKIEISIYPMAPVQATPARAPSRSCSRRTRTPSRSSPRSKVAAADPCHSLANNPRCPLLVQPMRSRFLLWHQSPASPVSNSHLSPGGGKDTKSKEASAGCAGNPFGLLPTKSPGYSPGGRAFSAAASSSDAARPVRSRSWHSPASSFACVHHACMLARTLYTLYKLHACMLARMQLVESVAVSLCPAATPRVA